ncbi:5-carboxymethyl-2-hydroxymuconate Delta-isomerase [Pseudooceanicola sp. MF1-13]|uniref:5-carboxymethyl-2-hydroxymuconate Delta-isomerase n=1 Tax=Pseudooceanicola sp. MF1-13 TaxID=3379095 RepID=UPI0038912FA7
MHIEYSRGCDADDAINRLCRAIYDAMKAAGIFPLAGIRVRAFCADVAIVADDVPENDFVAMTLSVGAGRSTEVLKAAGDQIFQAAQTALADRLAAPHFALSLEIREINSDLSWKDTPIHARLSKKD